MSKNFPNILEYDEDKGLYFHTLGKGVKIYRGDSNFNRVESNTENELNRVNNKMLSKKDNVFFGLSEDDINNYNYGRPFEFEVIKEGGIKLLRIDGEQTIGRIHEDAEENKEIQKIIEINYGFSTEGIGFRLSKKVEDDKFSRYLCNRYPEYDGYISERRAQKHDALNAEMSICNPIEKVRLTGNARGIKDDFQYTIDRKERRLKDDMEGKRKDEKKRKQADLSEIKGENLYEIGEEEKEDKDEEEQEEQEEEEEEEEMGSDKKPRVNTVLNFFGFSTPTTTPENGGKKKKNKKTKKNNKNKKKHTRKKKGKKN
jgi:hypothetical protein